VLGRACVITNLTEAKSIQHGDILITHCTDIGWSPYFPLLAGIVTELGGLISHGAVVAREYGLPCIIGAKTAVEVFQTGNSKRTFCLSRIRRVAICKNIFFLFFFFIEFLIMQCLFLFQAILYCWPRMLVCYN